MRMVKIRDVRIGEGMPKIIVPIVGGTKQDIMEEIDSVLPMLPDIVEWRVDFFEDVKEIKAVEFLLLEMREKLANVPLLFTFRSYREGGNTETELDFYHNLLVMAIQSKIIDLVDIELFTGDNIVRNLVTLAKTNGVATVISNHDFQRTPEKEEIISRLCKMQELGADIPKIAVMPNEAKDVLTLLEATNMMKTEYATKPFITISMEKKGLISRMAGELFGSAATFAVGKQASAPGQVHASTIREVLELLHIDNQAE